MVEEGKRELGNRSVSRGAVIYLLRFGRRNSGADVVREGTEKGGAVLGEETNSTFCVDKERQREKLIQPQ
jgi:hypothetical protein